MMPKTRRVNKKGSRPLKFSFVTVDKSFTAKDNLPAAKRGTSFMSYTWADAAYDEAMDNLYKDFSESALEGGELYDRIIDDFKEVRLREFYIDHPNLTEVPSVALAEAKQILGITPRCSLVLATTSFEVCVREALLVPILHGSFHSSSSGDLMAAIIATQRNERLTKALLPIFARQTGIDLLTFNRSGSRVTLAQEMSETQAIRNKILHQGRTATPVEAEKAIAIAECVLNEIFDRVIQKIGLHLHSGTVCSKRECVTEEPWL